MGEWVGGVYNACEAKGTRQPLCVFHPIWVLGGGGPKGAGSQPACAVFQPRQLNNGNCIAFGSAPRREAVSQLDRPAVSQTETHSLGFLSVADTAPSSGKNKRSQNWQWPNGKAGDCRLFGRRFEPWCGQYGSGAAAGVHPPGFEPPTEKSAVGCVTIRLGANVALMCLPLLGAFSEKLLTPPPHTRPQKSVVQF